MKNKFFNLIIKVLIVALIIYRMGISNLTIYEYVIFFLLVLDYLANRNKA